MEHLAKMNPLVRRFLPSVVGGVYRADEELAGVAGEQAFACFAKANRLCFLPLDLASTLRRLLSLEADFETFRRRLRLPGDHHRWFHLQDLSQHESRFLAQHRQLPLFCVRGEDQSCLAARPPSPISRNAEHTYYYRGTTGVTSHLPSPRPFTGMQGVPCGWPARPGWLAPAPPAKKAAPPILVGSGSCR